MKEVELYCDGACSGNPGPGGWGAILIYKGYEKEISGYNADTTNNRMELTAAIMGLKTLKEPCIVELYTDSSYVFNAFAENWITGWIKKGWVTSGKAPVKNKELWEELVSLANYHRINWHKVKGHADNKYNNRCDVLAVEEYKKHI